jgi:hypothetical protein
VSKSTRSGLFGTSTKGQTVTVIEAPIARSQRRKAIIAFWVALFVVGLLTGTVAAHYLHPIVGGLLGVVAGVATGGVLSALIVAWPILRIVWHWLLEITLGLALLYGWTWLMQHTDMWLSLLVVAVLAGVPAAWPPLRRRVLAVFWCFVVRHRLRLCFAAFIATNRQGTLLRR